MEIRQMLAMEINDFMYKHKNKPDYLIMSARLYFRIVRYLNPSYEEGTPFPEIIFEGVKLVYEPYALDDYIYPVKFWKQGSCHEPEPK